MSHGPAAQGSSAEPNLTPLLDMVLQLLMFFMMCVNFVTEQVNEGVTLPKAQSAKPMDKSETDVLFLNLNYLQPAGESANGRHELVVLGQEKPFDLGDP